MRLKDREDYKANCRLRVMSSFTFSVNTGLFRDGYQLCGLSTFAKSVLTIIQKDESMQAPVSYSSLIMGKAKSPYTEEYEFCWDYLS